MLTQNEARRLRLDKVLRYLAREAVSVDNSRLEANLKVFKCFSNCLIDSRDDKHKDPIFRHRANSLNQKLQAPFREIKCQVTAT